MDILMAKKVCKSYGKRNILLHFNYEFYPDHMYTITGASGTGKSTLIRILAGLDSNFDGDVCWNGSSIYHDKGATFRRKILGIQMQSAPLIPTLSVIDNVSLPLLLQGIPPQKSRELALRAIEYFSLSELTKSKIAQLSGGERKRVSIVAAIVRSPKVLILDEPTANLDEDTEQFIINRLCQYRAETRSCIIIATHSHAVINQSDCEIPLGSSLRGIAT